MAAAINGDVDYVPVRGAKKALESPAHKEADYPETYSRTSTGRRTALARWITSRENPLTARVAVNHVWMRHFGEPLVASMFDFGLRTPRPANANLLDYLAFELMESGWSFRHLHRLIVTSKTYRLSSSMANADETTVAADPDNQFYWRANGRRIECRPQRLTAGPATTGLRRLALVRRATPSGAQAGRRPFAGSAPLTGLERAVGRQE